MRLPGRGQRVNWTLVLAASTPLYRNTPWGHGSTPHAPDCVCCPVTHARATEPGALSSNARGKGRHRGVFFFSSLLLDGVIDPELQLGERERESLRLDYLVSRAGLPTEDVHAAVAFYTGDGGPAGPLWTRRRSARTLAF